MPRLPNTRRGEQTRNRLMDEALRAFSRDGFHATSVAGICRVARMANGSFYQYFPDKIDVFMALMERMRDTFFRRLEGASTPAETCARVFDFFTEAGPVFQVFREAEFLEVPHPRTIFYDEAVQRLMRSLKTDEATAWAAFGALTMTGLHFGIWEDRPVPEASRDEFVATLLRGIAPGQDERWQDLHLPTLNLETTVALPAGKGERTRLALVAEGRALFARQGYAATRISHITDAARVALGTFYVHFPGKRDLLAHLVQEIRAEMQRWVVAAVSGVSDRLELERRAFLAFLAYLERNRDVYRIVREAEFAEPEIGRGYYLGIHRDWSGLLKGAQKAGQVRKGDPTVQACFLMGAESLAGLRWVLWGDERQPPTAAIRATLRLVLQGLGPGSAPS